MPTYISCRYVPTAIELIRTMFIIFKKPYDYGVRKGCIFVCSKQCISVKLQLHPAQSVHLIGSYQVPPIYTRILCPNALSLSQFSTTTVIITRSYKKLHTRKKCTRNRTHLAHPRMSTKCMHSHTGGTLVNMIKI